MRVRSLQLENFRSYDSLTVDFSSGDVFVLLGPNAAGKTNILESIALLSLTRSSQGKDESDLIKWNTTHYRVRAEIEDDANQMQQLEIASQIEPRKKKACFANDVQVSIGQMVGKLPVVLFFPQDLDLFSGPPAQRRSFLDQLLCQVSPVHLVALSNYQKILKQRNSLLRKIAEGSAKKEDLQIWNIALADEAAKITLNRLELIEVFQCTLKKELSALGEDWDNVEIVYDRKGIERDHTAMVTEIQQLLRDSEKKDLILQTTSVGPHREDWRIEVDGRNVPSFASRGQQRTAVLALLFLEVSFLELRRGEKPVILLDDVFSELDDIHQSSLLHSLAGHQVVITTTHIPPQLHGAKVWKVENSGITEVESTK